ncbi:MAG TPA: hypothetical protein VM368_07140, partial [Flavisolibacter sp.]|nr:hypothetical protein [Flavisolibacter sp.]
QKRNDPYNYFAGTGNKIMNSSIDYAYTYKNLHVFGEAAVDKGFNSAFINGALVSVDPKVDVSFLHRKISPAYQAPFGNAFTENTLPSNESGFNAGIVLRPVISWQISAYADFYQFPFLKYRVNGPSVGRDYLFQIYFKPDRKSEIYFRYRNENKPINETGVGPINVATEKLRQNVRLHFLTQVHPAISLKSRGELVWYDKKGSNPEEGFLAYIEGSFKPSFRLSTNVRLQYFETDGYNSRIYTYESDVLYGFSIPPFFDKGFRYYFNVNYDVTKELSFWFRWAQTVYKNKTKIGSGLNEISGNKKTEIKFQVRYNL